MPQMAPMNWTILFNLVILLFVVTKTLIYFTFTPLHHSSESNSNMVKTSMNKLNWKW